MPLSSPLARRALISALLMAFAAPIALAQSASASSYNLPSARVLRAPPGQALGLAQQGGAVAAVAQALRDRGTEATTAASLVQLSSSRSKAGLTHVRMEQRVGGLTVYGSELKASFDAQGRLVHVAQRLAPVSGTPAAAAIGERQALDAALAHVHPDLKIALAPGARSGNTLAFKGGAFFHEDPRVTRVLVPQADGSLAQGFVVQTWTAKANQLHRTLVGGDGAVLDVELRTQKDSYAVFPVSPLVSAQTTVAGPGAGNVESPAGWLFAAPQTSWNINGNNVSAYLDTDANNAPDPGGTTVADGNFLFPVDLSASPSTAGNKSVAVQNLFFLNNRLHDILYSHGFTEAAGNFQVDNFGKGGSGNDPVNAEAQDGSGTDNANFSTPPDGSRPRMQMYLWTGAGATHEVVLSGNSFNAVPAAFGPQLDTTGLTGVLEAINDQGGVSPTDGCEPFTMRIPGLIALLDRGNCDFTLKVAHAQRAGAIAVVVANNNPQPPIVMGGSRLLHPRIPAVMVSRDDGATLRTASGSTVTLRMKTVLPLQVDGDLDSDIVYHEYGHGLSWRMIGGMSGPMGGAVGEGASDVLAFMINGDDRIAEYSASTPLGIRRAPYATYPLKYSGFTGEGVHNDGEIYAATMWRLRTDWLAAGRSNASLFDAFVGGMNFTPSTPAFEDMRNGMLDYIASTGAGDAAAQCTLVWNAFAAFEVGDGANALIRGKRVTITPSTVARTNCTHD